MNDKLKNKIYEFLQKRRSTNEAYEEIHAKTKHLKNRILIRLVEDLIKQDNEINNGEHLDMIEYLIDELSKHPYILIGNGYRAIQNIINHAYTTNDYTVIELLIDILSGGGGAYAIKKKAIELSEKLNEETEKENKIKLKDYK